MRSSSRPGPWRPVNAFAWWDRALSGTTAILPASVSRWSRSGARIVCSVFWFPSVGCGVTVLLVGGGRRRRTGTSSAGPRTALVRCPLLGAACGGSRPRAPSGPQSCGVDLPALARQALDLGRRPGRASGGGRLVAVLVERVGRSGARPAQAQEQPVRGVRLVFHVEQGLHGVTYRRDVPEPGADTRPGERSGESSSFRTRAGSAAF